MPGTDATIIHATPLARGLPFGRLLRLLVALAALAGLGTALWHLQGETAGLAITEDRAGGIPLTVFRPAAPGAAPVVVVAHGFAGSRHSCSPSRWRSRMPAISP